MKLNFSKRAISTLIAILMLMSAFSGITVFAERQYAADLLINGTAVDFKDAAYSEYNTVFVPFEELCGYLGLEFSREGSTYTLKRMRDTVVMDVDNMVINVNGKSEMLNSPLTTKNGVVYAPVELFRVAFNMQMDMAEDFRSVDIHPNIYSVKTNAENSAGISAANPDKDTLATGDSDKDSLFYKPTESPQLERSVYYKLDFTDFVGKDVANVTFTVNNAMNSNLYPTLGFIRTALWEKATINFNNQPAEMKDQKIASKTLGATYKQGAKNWLDMSFDITALTKNAIMDGGVLSLKALGAPYPNQKSPNSVQVYVKGVNTKDAPYALITVNESYVFPVKQIVQETVAGNKFSELQLLYSMGVFTEEDEFPLDMNETVSRGEFLNFAMRLRGSDIPAGSETQFFSDVPKENGYFAVTSSARELGYIAGSEGAAFRPYDDITIGEAVTILGRMLNYNIYAEERGGFTPGYFEAARHGDLYLGVNDNKSFVSFNKMIDLLENALDAKMLDVVKYTSDGKAEYIFNEEMTILTEFWDAQKIEGIVTRNEYSSITPGENGSEGYIWIGSKRLTLNYEPYNQFLGYKVKGYYSKAEDVLLYIGTVVNGDVTSVDINDIKGTSENASIVSFTYEKANGKKYTETFSKDAVVIYNGKSVERHNISSALLNADAGMVTLVGNDLVTIKAYESIVVAAVDSEENEEAIYDLYEDYDKAIRLKDAEWTLTDKEGKKVELSTVKMYDVVSVARSLDGLLIEGIISTKKAEGKVTMVENPGTPDMVATIGGIEYELRNITPGPDFDGDVYWSENVKLGSEGTFLLNHENNIVGFYTMRNEDILGYVVDIQSDGKSALGKNLQAAVMIQGNEEFVTFDLADKVVIDGDKKDNADEILSYFYEDVIEGGVVTGQQFKMQGIIFSLNGDKKINKIDTAYFNEEKEVNIENSLQLVHKTTDSELRYKGSGKLGDKFFWTVSKSLSVVMPKNAESYEDYMVITSGVGNDEKIKPEVYTVGNKTPNASIVVLKSYNPGSGAGEELFVADKIVTAFDADGYEVKKLYYHSSPDKKLSIIVPEEILPKLEQKPSDAASDDPRNANVIDTISPGDIIRIGKDARGELSAIVEEYDYASKTFRKLMYGTNDFNAEDRYYGGYTVEIFEDQFIKAAPSIDTMDTTYSWIKKSEISTFYRYEVANGGVELFTAKTSDIRPYENVPYNPTGILLHSVYARVDGKAFLLDMAQPANTGIYKLQYGVTSDVTNAGGTEGFPSPVRANPGDLLALASFPTYLTREDYRVNAEKPWIVDGVEYAAGELIAISSEIVTVTPNWEYYPTIKLTLKPGEGTSENGDIVYYPAENGIYQAISVSAFTKAGYEIIGWNDGTTNYLVGEEIQLTDADLTLTAVWTKVWDRQPATEAPATTTIDGQTFYQLEDEADFLWYANARANDNTLNAILMNDIYLNKFITKDQSGNFVFDEKWYEKSANVSKAFNWMDYRKSIKGTFDGNGKAIYGFYSRDSHNGLFESIAGNVKNLKIMAGYIVSTAINKDGSNQSGMLSRYMSYPAVIENVETSGLITVAGSTNYAKVAGGLVGFCNTSTAGNKSYVKNCISRVDIDTSMGGMGYNTSLAYVTNVGVGGIVGYAERNLYIQNCTNYGNINAPSTKFVGGILGVTKVRGTGASSLTGNVNYGDIIGYECVGQIIGESRDKHMNEDTTLNVNASTCLGSATTLKQ